MTAPEGGPSRWTRVPRTVRPQPIQGREALLLGALVIGLLMLAIQLWLLTVALELYLGGSGEHIWGLALVSGGVFLGGVLTVRLFSRHPRIVDTQ